MRPANGFAAPGASGIEVRGRSMIDDDEFNAFVIGSLRRALEHGGEAFAMQQDDTFLRESFDRCSIVFALWPDAQSKCGFAMMPIKREPPPDPHDVKGEVLPCP